MNELAFADEIRRALDEGLDHLPYRVTNRLERARSLALERMPEPAAESLRTARLAAATGHAPPPDPDDPGPWLRWLAVPLAGAVLFAGLVAVSQWSDQRRAQEIADIDVAMLADDVPLTVYADKGFGVYLKNSNQ